MDLSAVRFLVDDTALERLPLLSEVATTTAFVASDGAGAITGAVVQPHLRRDRLVR